MNLRYSEYERMQARRTGIGFGRVIAVGMVFGFIAIADPKNPFVAFCHNVGHRSVMFAATHIEKGAAGAKGWAEGKLSKQEPAPVAHVEAEPPTPPEYEHPGPSPIAVEAPPEETTVMVLNFDSDYELEDQALPIEEVPEEKLEPKKQETKKSSSSKKKTAEVTPKVPLPDLPVGDDGASEQLFLVANLLPRLKEAE